MATQTQDDGFHEIQLNGKQLVFLFMAATVVSVVIFLCGVLVGRGVRSAQDLENRAAVNTTEPTADSLPFASVAPVTPATPAAISGAGATPSATPGGRDAETPVSTRIQVPTDELRPDPSPAPRAPEQQAGAPATSTTEPSLSPAVAAPVVKVANGGNGVKTSAAPASKPAPVLPATEKPVRAPAPTAVPSSAGSASADGWVVQLAALNDRGEAEDIARRLVGKGYGAFVVSPASGNPTVFRVRVGTFKTKGEADMVGARLKKEERFDPWITR